MLGRKCCLPPRLYGTKRIHLLIEPGPFDVQITDGVFTPLWQMKSSILYRVRDIDNFICCETPLLIPSRPFRTRNGHHVQYMMYGAKAASIHIL